MASTSGGAAPPQRSGEEPPARQVARWVEAARGGDRAAFGALVRAYGGLVDRVIGRLVRDPDDRDDLVQETFLRALEGLDHFRPGAAFRPWLVTIALNAARDHLRAGQRWRGVSLDAETPEGTARHELVDPAPAPDAVAAGAELAGRLETALERLEPGARVILWLRAHEGLSYAEIASVLGVATGTVMSRLSRARRALREFLAAAPPPPRVAEADGEADGVPQRSAARTATQEEGS